MPHAPGLRSFRRESLIWARKLDGRVPRGLRCEPSPDPDRWRLILHGADYWLLYMLRAAAPKRSPLRRAEFTTLRLRLIKIAARVVEGAARIRVWLPTACPDRATFALLAGRFATAGP